MLMMIYILCTHSNGFVFLFLFFFYIKYNRFICARLIYKLLYSICRINYISSFLRFLIMLSISFAFDLLWFCCHYFFFFDFVFQQHRCVATFHSTKHTTFVYFISLILFYRSRYCALCYLSSYCYLYVRCAVCFGSVYFNFFFFSFYFVCSIHLFCTYGEIKNHFNLFGYVEHHAAAAVVAAIHET